MTLPCPAQPWRHSGILGVFLTGQLPLMPIQRIILPLKGTAGIGPVICIGTFSHRTAGQRNERLLQFRLILVFFRQISGHILRHQNGAIDKGRAAAQSKLFLLHGIPGHEFGNLIGVGSRRRQIVPPVQGRCYRNGAVIGGKAVQHMVRRPANTGKGFFIFSHRPRRKIAKGSHAVLLHIVTAQIQQGQINEPPQFFVSRNRNLALSGINAELTRHRAIQPHKGRPGVGTR